MKKLNIILLFAVILISGCERQPVPDQIPFSVKSNFNLLQEKPQFVFYLNFKNMRQSNFWAENISDSILNAEKTFGSLLGTFKTATGASISDGLDELYYSNSWSGENAIVLKGIFDKNKLNAFLQNDTMFTKTKHPDGAIVYMHTENHLYFFFKDNFTICASNHPSQIDAMYAAKDTSRTGLMLNDELIKSIQPIVYKENLWMVSTEKMFIRGIFMNFVESKMGENAVDKGIDVDTLFKQTPGKDSVSKTDEILMNRLHERINSISFSAKMKANLDIIVQFECTDVKAAQYIQKVINGLISLSRINTAIRKEKEPAAVESMLDNIEIKTYDSSVHVNIKVTKENINAFRKSSFLTQPAQK